MSLCVSSVNGHIGGWWGSVGGRGGPNRRSDMIYMDR